MTQPVSLVAAVGPICQHARRTESRPAPIAPLDLASIQQCLERCHLMALPGGEQEGQRPSLTIAFQVNLRPESSLRATECFVAVPLFAPAAL